MRNIYKFIPLTLFFLLLFFKTFAHPISITWAEVNVGKTKVSVRLRVLAEDLFLFHGLMTDHEDKISMPQFQIATERHKDFLLKHFYINDEKGRKLPAKITKVEPLTTTERGINVSDLMEHSLFYHFEFDCFSQPKALKFTQHFGGKESVINAIMMLNISQEGLGDLPPTEVRKEKTTKIALDWNRTPQSITGNRQRFEAMKAKKENETLGITSYSSVYSFIYIENFEVRHEVLIPVATLESWFKIVRKEKSKLTIAEQNKVGKLLTKFFEENNPVAINGHKVPPVVERIDFFGLNFKDFAKKAEPKDLDFINARAGIILRYPTQENTQKLKMTWNSFNKSVRTLKSVVYAFDEDSQTKFTRFSPSFKWENKGMAKVEEVKAIKSEEGSWLSYFFGDDVDEEDANKLTETLLKNIYQSFKFPSESEVYDALAVSVEGDLLSKIYLDFKKSLVMQEQGGAISKVKSVKVISGEKQDVTEEEAFGYLCSWTVAGTVEHWGHIHERENEYMALFTIKNIEGAWKVVNLKPLNQKRLTFKTSVRSLMK